MAPAEISADFPFNKHHVPVLDTFMAYVDTALPTETAPTVVFLHGNLTSSYLYRNIVPHNSPIARCIVPDLVGCGDSGKMPSNGYYIRATTFATSPRLWMPWFPRVISFSFSSTIGALLWASTGLVKTPQMLPVWSSWSLYTGACNRKTSQVGRYTRSSVPKVLGGNLSLRRTRLLRSCWVSPVLRRLSEGEMEHYRKTFLKPADREPTWRFPNGIPFHGRAPDVLEMVREYWVWLKGDQNRIPKLMFWVEPGALLPSHKVHQVEDWLHNLKSISVGPGKHFLPEDNPHLIGAETKRSIEEVMDRK